MRRARVYLSFLSVSWESSWVICWRSWAIWVSTVFELYAEVVYVALPLLDVFLGFGEVLLAGFDLLLELGLLGFEGADFLAVLGGEGEGEQQGGEGEQEVSGCHCAGWLEGVILSWS